MVSKKEMGSPEQKLIPDDSKQVEGSGEYGIEQFLVPDEEDLVQARKLSSYHYSQEQLQHKEDRVGGKEKQK